GALGNPWLFGEIKAAIEGEPAPAAPTLRQRMEALRTQVYQTCEEKGEWAAMPQARDRKSTRLNSSHVSISYAVFCVNTTLSDRASSSPVAPRCAEISALPLHDALPICGALGNPWLFGEIKAAIEGEPAPAAPTLRQRMEALRTQVYQTCEEKGEWAAMPQA